MIVILAYIALLLLPLAEGWREYIFYRVNKAAGFPFPAQDSTRKRINAALFGALALLLCHLASGLTLAAAVLFIASLFWRWLALDALLNLLRELPLFYAGQSGRSTTDSFLAQFPTPGRAILKIAPLAIVLFLYIALKYLTP
ncbi:MAG: hypothetical protein RI842_09710 [Schleiferiaceae bacterium]|nr:hypothetical protein [Schleiferiaceae bacterium]